MAPKNAADYTLTVSFDQASLRLVKAQSKALLRAHEGVMAAIRQPGKKALEEAAKEMFVVGSLVSGKLTDRFLAQTAELAGVRAQLSKARAQLRKARALVR